jgi:uncharacterized protein (TIGR00251 family)
MSDHAIPIHDRDGGVEWLVKVVPGSKRDAIVGPLGNCLKIKVSAPPEDGKANAAVCALLAKTLGVPPRDVQIIEGHSHPRKKVRIEGINSSTARRSI